MNKNENEQSHGHANRRRRGFRGERAHCEDQRKRRSTPLLRDAASAREVVHEQTPRSAHANLSQGSGREQSASSLEIQNRRSAIERICEAQRGLRRMWLTLNAADRIASDQELLVSGDDIGVQGGIVAADLPL